MHTKHRPKTKAQTQAVHMTTLLLKVFPNIKTAPKNEMSSFKSTFVPSRNFNFSSKKIDILKSKAAEFLETKFESLNHNPNMATLQPSAPRQPKQLTKWKLPNLFGDMVVTNKVLPLGYTSVGLAPNPTR